MKYFVADLHLFHKNVMKFGPKTRGVSPEGIAEVERVKREGLSLRDTDDSFFSVGEMNRTLIGNWNSQVEEEDEVYILGDFSFGGTTKTIKVLKQLKGKKHFIMGNHDQWLKPEAEQYFESISDYKQIYIDKTLVCMFHYPIKEWNKMHHGAFHLFGHVHGKDMGIKGKALDVGIDNRPNGDMKLWSWEEIKKYMEKRPIESHH